MDQPNSTSQAAESQDLNSLQRLDPSPIDTPPELDKQLPDLSPASLPRRSTTLGLSGSGHGAVYYLTRLQRYSSYAFTIFASFHITNTAILPLITQSVPSSESYLLLTRPYYQSTFGEPLLIILPLFTHIVAGLVLRIHRRNASISRYGAADLSAAARLATKTHVWPPISTISICGYILTPLVLGHAFVNRILPWWIDGGSSGVGLGYVSHGFAKHPAISWTGYTALVAVASGHIVWGWAKWLDWTPVGRGQLSSSGKRGKRRWWAINGIAGLIAAVWMAGGLGIVGRGGKGVGWEAKAWDELYSRIPLVKL
ncbi:MAG: hypothetical protein M1818_001365 [Claussenomyces sp. TS43310]|nr:MAG: hypothetical protein M1818_001365 [Claussenomyces sp. TS43310]